jgi:hypothetical protein
VVSTKDEPGKDLNVRSAKWCFLLSQVRCKCQNCSVGLCFDPASGCFMANRSSQTNISQGKADYTVVSTTFHYVQIFLECQCILYEKGKEVWIL